MTLKIHVIPEKNLYLPEPNPFSFGNPDNPPVQPPFWSAENWLQTRFHFSFAEYDNPSNETFGVLRVMNDDLVQPERGFATHAHRDMEIITYVVSGELTHEDSMGNAETLQRGSVQYMTAGTGVEHSEHNRSEDTPMRCIQTWILPKEYGLKPNYGSYSNPGGIKVGDSAWENTLKHLASSVDNKAEDIVAPVRINQDVDCYAAELELGAQVLLELPKGRMAYMLCIEGAVSVASESMTSSTSPVCSGQHFDVQKHDGCEITGTGGAISITATETESTENGDLAHVLLFTMATAPNAGRSDSHK
ncbi:pirin-like protein [Nitzschia inconspicua]|uniref:Pirin-like protein n=1 Tax=Nitzschia inconspicua TaxID=303405 RepID=A0A9K3KIG9_9STRA|nr:pirin-like protein [Nitzschia inconspicua]